MNIVPIVITMIVNDETKTVNEVVSETEGIEGIEGTEEIVVTEEIAVTGQTEMIGTGTIDNQDREEVAQGLESLSNDQKKITANELCA